MTSIKRSWQEPFDPTYRYSTSWCLPPLLLSGFQALRSLYCFVVLFVIYGYQGAHRGSETSQHSFSYFTYLTWYGLAFYFAFAALHSGTYATSGTPLLARFPRWLQTAQGIFFTTIVIFPFLVTVVFWALIHSNGTFRNQFQLWSNVSMHALNSVFAFLELLLLRAAPPPWLHLIPIVVILALYLGLAYLTWSLDHFWVYSFLDNRGDKGGTAAGYIIAILVCTCALFAFIKYLIQLRVWATETKGGMLGKFSPRDAIHGRGIVMRDPATAAEMGSAEVVDVRDKPTEMEMYPAGARDAYQR